MTNENDFTFINEFQEGSTNMKHYPLTKREYFSAMALQGLLASGFQTSMEMQCESAIDASDTLIKALNKTK